MKIVLRKIAATNQLAQANRLGAGKMLAASHGGPVPFSRTLAASMTADLFFEIGQGSVDPGAYAKLFLQYAYDSGIRLETLATAFYEYVGAASKSSALWRMIAGFITGSTSRLVDASRLGQVPPEEILREIRKNHPHEHDIFVYALADCVTGVLAPLGLIYGDTTFAYRITRTPVYPDFNAIVDIVAARQLKSVLTALANVDVSTLRRQIADKKTLNPAMLASVLNQAMHVAWDRSRGAYGASDVSIAVLSALGRSWDMSLSGGAELPTRVRNAAGFEELHTNLGLFLAYQDMISVAKVSPGAVTMNGVPFPDEEMATVIIPMFREALTEVSPFAIRPLGDCVSMVGMTSSRRHDGYPGLQVVYEDWAAPEEMVAFVPVRLSHTGNERFLAVDDGITERLSLGMAPAVRQFGVPEFAIARRSTHDLTPPHSRVASEGPVIMLAMPSLTERDIAAGRDPSLMHQYLKTGKVVEGGKEVPVTRLQKWMAFSAYAHLVHLAVAKSGITGSSVEVARASDDKTAVSGAYSLFLRWIIPSVHKEAIGTAAVYQGSVTVHEPLEAIAYSEDFSPTSKMVVPAPPLKEFQDAIHIWDFKRVSNRVSYVSTYTTKLRNRDYMATVTEREILGFGAERPRLMTLSSPIARSIVMMWKEWFFADLASVRAGKNAKDAVQQAVYEGAELSIALDVLTRLVHLGSTGLGANVSAAITNQIRDSLVSAGHIDDTSDLGIGIQQTSIALYAGLVTLELLGLMDAMESGQLTKIIQDTRALSIWVASLSSRR